MSPPKSSGNQELAESLTRGIQAAANQVQGLAGEVRDNSVALATFSSDLRHLREDVGLMKRIVMGSGDGHDSLVTSKRLTEEQIEAFGKKLDEIGKRLEELESEEKKRSSEGRQHKWQFWGTLIPAVLALIGSGLAYLFK